MPDKRGTDNRGSTVSKFVKDFLDEPSEKNSDSEVVHFPPYADFISGVF